MIKDSESVRYLKGVGPARAAKLARVGVHTVRDLLEYFPREWSDRRHFTPINKLVPAKKTTVRGIVLWHSVQQVSKRLGIFHLFVKDKTGSIDAVWIRTISYRYDVFSSLSKKCTQNQEIILFGQVDCFNRVMQFKVEDYEIIEKGKKVPDSFNCIVPVYPLTEGVDQRFMRDLVHRACASLYEEKNEAIPRELLNKRNLLDRNQAIREIHFPSTMERKEKARQSLAYEEFLLIEFALALQRQQFKNKHKEHSYEIRRNLLTPFRENLSFQFTNAQKKVIREIFDDMRSSHVMSRLLQGDVGSGKTVVAVAAMLLAVENGYQAACMAPTEILAEQHYYTIRNLCRDLPVRIRLIKGNMRRKERVALLKDIHSGEVSMVIGTHALVEHDVRFKNLKLVIIDEQHRFGVIQRARLKSKGKTDTLIMTATPIPRTLALTVYGDLDVSILDEMPPGRMPVTTRHLSEEQAYDIIRKEIEKHNQVYVVYPLIEESEKKELRSLLKEWERLKISAFSSYRVGLLHGQMPHAMKDNIMNEFAAGKYDILMATTVIEVGIDVPRATVMLIQHANQFGLATLHQLRGRVGRGDQQSFCLLVGEPSTTPAFKRFNIMQETSDGFRIGEEDLRLRGPGEFLGTAQHGLPMLKAGDFLTDIHLIQSAREDAVSLINNYRDMRLPDNQKLLQLIRNRFGRAMHLVQVG